MAEPKKKLSKTRTHRRRSTYKSTVVEFVLCTNCGASIRTHQVCPKCGFYRGKMVKPKLPTERIVVDADTK